MSQTEREAPLEPRPMSDAEWDHYLTELVAMQMKEEFGFPEDVDEQE